MIIQLKKGPYFYETCTDEGHANIWVSNAPGFQIPVCEIVTLPLLADYGFGG
jgi:hypothetical protein